MVTHREYLIASIKESITPELVELIAELVETADVQGGYNSHSGNDSVWEDDVQATLNALADEIRNIN